VDIYSSNFNGYWSKTNFLHFVKLSMRSLYLIPCSFILIFGGEDYLLYLPDQFINFLCVVIEVLFERKVQDR
jgi:hypothetical protein